MKAFFTELNVPASVASGTAQLVQDYREKTVQLFGTFVATVEVQISLDGTNYITVGAALTAAGVVTISQTCKYVRLKTTAFTSGTPQALFGGFDARSE